MGAEKKVVQVWGCLIEVHGEKIYVESVVDVGSEFSFTLEKVKAQPN